MPPTENQFKVAMNYVHPICIIIRFLRHNIKEIQSYDLFFNLKGGQLEPNLATGISDISSL